MSRKLVTLIVLALIALLFLLVSSLPGSKSIPNSFVNFNPGLIHIFENKDVSILLTGDIMLGRSVMTKSLGSNDPNYPFREVADKLNEADIVFSNLENPIISGCPKTDSGFKFCADPRMIGGLKFAGIDIVNLANNHTLNYGKDGLEETKKILEENQIKWIGDGNLEIIDKQGIKFGFLGFDFVTKEPTKNDYELVKNSSQKVDVLIVGIHWGKEYSDKATLAQKEIARKLVENGADVIAGHHSHWVQDIEYINEKPVYYSLGNLVFDQSWSEETKKGLAIKLIFRDSKLVKEKKLPIYMRNFAQPEWSN